MHPRGLLIEALKLTLFADPRVHVEGVERRESPAERRYGSDRRELR